jgi:4-diphosphocytidyl-2-C-methyl-D-erythritol kinase
MHAIDLADDVEMRALEHGEASRHRIAWAADEHSPERPVEWPLDTDLAVRAHRALETLHARALPAHVRVRKRIPAGGGLGGGSADAAAVLLGLDALFGLRTPEHDLVRTAMSLGSDVAFFVDRESFAAGLPPRPAVVSGFGERIARRVRTPGALVLAIPGVPCPTGAVYAAYDRAPSALDVPRVLAAAEEAAGAGGVVPGLLLNDLTRAAEAVAPEVARVRTALAGALGRLAFVTGSGSTVFACCGGRESAEELAERAAEVLDPGETAEWAREALKALGGGGRFAGLLDDDGPRARVVAASLV